MTGQPSSISSLRKLAAAYPGSENLTDLVIDASRDPNHHAGTLAAVSLLEGALKELLITKLIIHEKYGTNDLFGSTAPLRAFSAKIKMGFALGLYGSATRDDLHTIREVRNAFAHTMTPITLNTQEIANVCKRVRFFERMGEVKNYPMDWADLPTTFIIAVGYLTIALDSMAQEPAQSSLRPESSEPESIFDAIRRTIAE